MKETDQQYRPEWPLSLKLANGDLYPFATCHRCGIHYSAAQMNFSVRDQKYECAHCFGYKMFKGQIGVNRQIAENAETQAQKNHMIFKNQFGELAERVKAIEEREAELLERCEAVEMALNDLNGVRREAGE